MAQRLEIELPGAIQTVEIIPGTDGEKPSVLSEQQINADKSEEAVELCKCLNNVLNSFNEFKAKFTAEHKKGITGLSIEIAKKILCKKIEDGDYEIQAIIEEALKHSPARKDIIIELNPKDFEEINSLQENGRIEAFSGIKFVPNSEIKRAECILETPKGIVESFISEHLERVEKAFSAME